ncbi:MAG: hypothetical protein EBR35_02705 [Flavobacteriales bacterium]|jgi:hypothetical protein|nr:hypothetical protein [Crocinitomicaceae bacterium]NBW30156.1 hypothetical protein [Flavobacteriales bacterium]NDA97656.1 hypothetical protein [Flavobacteriia bacterium]NDC27824.1 hypothetical protein [Crocinitomicaceae bacterium]NDC92642.1 hypothetical protein [Flavobacteriales bacterium]
MKKTLLFTSILTVILFSSCKKTKYGDATFWQQTGSGYDLTVVNIDGVTSNITSEYPSAPSCGSSGCAVFNHLETGTYNYTASDGTATWSGTVDITEDCSTYRLY